MNANVRYTYLATVRWGDSLANLVGDNLRELATAAIKVFRLPARVQDEMRALVFAELDKPVPTIDYTKPYTLIWAATWSIAFDSPKCVGAVGSLTGEATE